MSEQQEVIDEFDAVFAQSNQPLQQQVQPNTATAMQNEVVPPTTTTEADKEPQVPAPEPAKKKVFTRNDIVRFVPIKVVFPRLYPDYEPFGFKFRLKLSATAEEQRQQYLALSAVEITEKLSDQSLNEVCDLLFELPTGFGDLYDTGQGPGHSFRSYVETNKDPEMKSILEMIVNAADTAYWTAVAPREFRG